MQARLIHRAFQKEKDKGNICSLFIEFQLIYGKKMRIIKCRLTTVALHLNLVGRTRSQQERSMCFKLGIMVPFQRSRQASAMKMS